MIRFLNVTKQFGDGTVALEDISFEVEPGEFLVITGPSGSGKTTLMKLLIRDYSPSQGEVYFGDTDLNALEASSIPFHRRKVGVIFQDYRLLSELNVWENIALPLAIAGKPKEEIESRVTDLLNLISLEDKALMFPKQLSGGEAQRVGIARALATGPSVIFADEPTGNLDKKASLEIVKLLQQINELGTTVILSTHDSVLLEALKKHRQIELDQGKIRGMAGSKKVVKKIKPDKEEKEEEAEEPEIVKKETPSEETTKKTKKPFKLKIPFFSKRETGDALEEALNKVEEMKEEGTATDEPMKKDEK